MTNFSFIPPLWKDLRPTLEEAERFVYDAPDYCAMLCRRSLEQWVRWLYEHDADLELPYDTTLNNLLYQESFKRLLSPGLIDMLTTIRKTGNNAAHGNKRTAADDALHLLRLQRLFVAYVVQLYSQEEIKVPEFDKSLVPEGSAAERKKAEKSKAELAALEKKYEESLAKLEKVEANLVILQAIREHNISYIPAAKDDDEKHTRAMYIDALLVEAGWQTDAPNVEEYPLEIRVKDGKTGKGRADYVLWGQDGLPLAVVEAKRKARDPRDAANQAKLYAEALYAKFGQFPVIYCSNGYKLWMWDFPDYPLREVMGFHTREELQTLVQRRQSKRILLKEPVNEEIAGRLYQLEAIRAVSGAFDSHHRGALLVMATGTGKTRVAAAIIDLMSKANWVKRVLFLADRNALITQAKNSFNKLLPNLPAVDLTKEKEDESARVVFSTYQTMIRLIDGERDGKNRYFGVGHFDLVIFDEIHRSVYNKYKAIFYYFDGLRLGLTATPKENGDKDTYALFHLQPGDPTFAYQLEQGVADRFLVPYRALSVPLKFQREGIKYNELSEEDKLAYEEEFADPVTGELPEAIDASALNNWLFNKDTVIKALAFLMDKGIKVAGEDVLGKTIIFTKSHKHSLFVKKVFDEQYPEWSGDFLQLIDYQTERHEILLEDFKIKHRMPQIAVSVDMLDTGIDVPEICNLVFFKIVRSASKFWQMMGRGTRLCEDLFGPGMHKAAFEVLDYCQNLEFFNANPKGREAPAPKSLSQRLFETRMEIVYLIQNAANEEAKEYGEELSVFLLNQIRELNKDNFMVRQELALVEKFTDESVWTSLGPDDLRELKKHLAGMVTEVAEDEMAKRFDGIMLDLQLAKLKNAKAEQALVKRVKEIAQTLSKKTAIPVVKEKLPLIKEIQRDDYWVDLPIAAVDVVRKELRNLLFALDKEQTRLVFTNFEDTLHHADVAEIMMQYAANDLNAYRTKVEEYVRQHSDDFVIRKLKYNKPLSKGDLHTLEHMLFDQGQLGTREDLQKAYGEMPLGMFIRSIVGLDEAAVRQAFKEFVSDTTLNALQIRFIDQIIRFLTAKGTLTTAAFFEPPFTDIHSGGISNVFDINRTRRIISLIEDMDSNTVEVG